MSENNVSFVFTDNSVTVSFPVEQQDGSREFVTKQVLNGTEEYKDVVAAIKDGRWNDIAGLISPEQKILEFSEGYIRVENGVIIIDDKEVPAELSERIIKFANEGLPYMSLVNFFRNLQLNPSFRSVKQCFQFLEANHYPLTPSGCFVGYKKVKKCKEERSMLVPDGTGGEVEVPANKAMKLTDGYTGTFDNTPGQTVSMPRNEVDEDPDATCSNGLHVASYDYAHNYGGDVMIEVKVNPRDVVAVPSDHGAAKMRVCEYLSLGIAQERIEKEHVDYSTAEQRARWSEDRLEDWDNPDDSDEEEDEEDGDDW